VLAVEYIEGPKEPRSQKIKFRGRCGWALFELRPFVECMGEALNAL